MKHHYLLHSALAALTLLGAAGLNAAESHVKILGNDYVPPPAPQRTEGIASDILAEEDFSEFPGASITNPVTIIPKYERGYIPNQYTNGDGWWGTGVDGAAGMCYLRNDNPQTYASLRTPLGDWSGRITITMRVRCFQNPSEGGYKPTCNDFQITPHAYGSNYAETDLENNFLDYRFYEKDGWAEITATFDNYSTDCEGYIDFSSDTDFLIDDLKITTSPDFIAPPTMLQLTDVSDTGFTINWMPVRKSTNYYIHLFTLEGYDKKGNPIFERANPNMSSQELEEYKKEYYTNEDGTVKDSWLTDPYCCYVDIVDVNARSYTFSGLDPDKEYYYCVLSHYWHTFSGMDRKYHAMYASAPELLPATDIDKEDGSYTAHWKPVERAEGYIVSNYGVYHLDEDMEDYPLLEEDFSGFDALSDGTGLGDMDIPSNEVDQVALLNSATALPGWECQYLGYAQGKAGISYGWSGSLQTPPLYVKDVDHITLTLGIETELDDQVISIYFGGARYQVGIQGAVGNTVTGEVEIPTNGYIESPLIFTSGDAQSTFLLDYVRVGADIPEGSYVYVFRDKSTLYDPKADNFDFSSCDFSDYADYAFQVNAFRQFVDPLMDSKMQTCTSAYAGRQHVLTPLAELTLQPVDDTVDPNAPVEYYNLQGQRVANPDHGIYIKVQGGRATKVAR